MRRTTKHRLKRALKSAITFLCIIEMSVFLFGHFIVGDWVETHVNFYNPINLGILSVMTSLIFVYKYFNR